MNGSNLLLDTNILLYALKGIENVRPYFDYPSLISIITEIEILGVKDIDKDEIKVRESIIAYQQIIPITQSIKNKAIELKRKNKIPIPDAIIAATAIEQNIPLVTADKGFKRIKELELFLIEL